MKLAQLVLGPAGVGKSTYCKYMCQHCEEIGRAVQIFNLDPAAEEVYYPVSGDIRDLVTLTDVIEEMNLGPNGGLMYCMEYFEENMDEWLSEALEGYCDDDYIIFDCPGQAELYTNSSVFKNFINYLQNGGWTVCAVYCLDSHFITDISKFIAGNFQALSTMIHLEGDIQEFLMYDSDVIFEKLNELTDSKSKRLNKAISELIEEYNIVSFFPLDITDDDSIHAILMNLDQATQFGDDLEVKTADFGPQD